MLDKFFDFIGTYLSIIIGDAHLKRRHKGVTILFIIIVSIGIIFAVYEIFVK